MGGYNLIVEQGKQGQQKKQERAPRQWGLRLLLAIGVLAMMVLFVLIPMYF